MSLEKTNPYLFDDDKHHHYTYCVCILPLIQDNLYCKECDKINIKSLYEYLSNKIWNMLIEYDHGVIPMPYMRAGIACAIIKIMCTNCKHLHKRTEELCYFYPKCECEMGDSKEILLNADAYEKLLMIGPITPIKEIRGI